MRNYKTLIEEATLLALPAESVEIFLKLRATEAVEKESDVFSDVIDEDVELALLNKNDQLITISLARYGRHTKTLGRIFNESPAESAARLAVLSNRAHGGQVLSSWTDDLFGTEEGLAEWIEKASENEVAALFQNPALDSSFLSDFLQRKDHWGSVREDQFLNALQYLGTNERMWTPYNYSFMDGYTEFKYSDVFDSAWRLAQIAPITKRWSVALAGLLYRLTPHCISIEPLECAKRWVVSPENPELGKGARMSCEYVRESLARLALNRGAAVEELLESDDIALRRAVYSNAYLDLDGMKGAHEKDGLEFFNAACFNNLLWRSMSFRELLREMAWIEVRNNRSADLGAANLYNARKEVMLKNHPEWFLDEAGECETGSPSAEIIADPMIEAVDHLGSLILRVQGACNDLSKDMGMIRWIALGALAIAILGSFT